MAFWVCVPKVPVTDTLAPAPLRCSWAHTTQSPFEPREIVGSTACLGAAVVLSACVAARKPDALLCDHSHQLTPGEPYAVDSARKRLMSFVFGNVERPSPM